MRRSSAQAKSKREPCQSSCILPTHVGLLTAVLVLLLAGCVPVSPSSARTASGPARFPGTLVAELRRFEIGRSAGGLPIEAYRFGRGPIRLVLVGGIHGGYEWNTILLAYAVIDHYHTHAAEIPASLTLDIVPVANPDGQLLVTGKAGRFMPSDITAAPAGTIDGRFNRNGVDLNRNWECDWSPTAQWRSRRVSGGAAPFSEAETTALRQFLSDPPPAGVIFWHSAAGGVFAGGCDGRFAAADALATTFADSSGYPFRTSFASYRVTGDATNWLSLQGIPAIDVELYNHDDIDMAQNLDGVEAVLSYLGTAR